MFPSFAGAWWEMLGYSTPALQKLAISLISQCASATGCEQNWSTFAFIYTKVRNRLTYEKLYKLVYVNYNLRIQNNIGGGSRHDDDDDDPFNRLMELILVDASNPIREWMERARSTVQPELFLVRQVTTTSIISIVTIITVSFGAAIIRLFCSSIRCDCFALLSFAVPCRPHSICLPFSPMTVTNMANALVDSSGSSSH
jgi:hypothetical protein